MLRLKELREEKNILQKDLADAINRTRACISSWEQGKTEPSIDDLLKLADFFDVSVDCLVGREGEFANPMDNGYKGIESSLLNLIRTLPESEQYRLLGYAEALSQVDKDRIPSVQDEQTSKFARL